MREKLEGLKTFMHDKAAQVTHSVNEFVESDETKAAVAWTKNAVNTAKVEATDLGKRVAQSEMGKDAATGAAIGAAVAVPIPIIGPVIGEVLGAGAGVAMNIKLSDSRKAKSSEDSKSSKAPEIDIHKKLIDLDDLRQKGILTQEEFETQKQKFLKRISAS